MSKLEEPRARDVGSANFKVLKEVVANCEGQEIRPVVASGMRVYRGLFSKGCKIRNPLTATAAFPRNQHSYFQQRNEQN